MSNIRFVLNNIPEISTEAIAFQNFTEILRASNALSRNLFLTQKYMQYTFYMGYFKEVSIFVVILYFHFFKMQQKYIVLKNVSTEFYQYYLYEHEIN